MYELTTLLAKLEQTAARQEKALKATQAQIAELRALGEGKKSPTK